MNSRKLLHYVCIKIKIKKNNWLNSYARYFGIKYQLMSIKSLLQFILVLLIFLIVGGIYYLYFYTEPSKDEITFNKNTAGINNEKMIEENTINKESLEEIASKNFSDKKQDQINFNKKDIKIVNGNKIENSRKPRIKQIR